MKKVILYTMKGCPWCQMMKDELKEARVKYIERDIDDHKDEYDLFVEATSNDYLPALMLITLERGKSSNVELLAPDRDFKEISEAVEKVKNYL
jgi:glutaredoxin